MDSKRVERNNFLVEEDIINENFEHSYIYNMNAKEKLFRRVNFKYCIFDDCYFHKAKFEKCDFTGTQIRKCNFRSATFIECTFDYVNFAETILQYDQLILNLPSEVNKRRSILKNLQVNAIQTGEHEILEKLSIEEMKAVKEHYKKAYQCKDSYYRKYQGIERAKYFLKYIGVSSRQLLWNHGYSYFRVILFSEILMVICSIINTAKIIKNETSFGEISKYFFCVLAETNKIFLDIAGNQAINVNDGSIIFLVILRYIVVGLVINIFFAKNLKK